MKNNIIEIVIAIQHSANELEKINRPALKNFALCIKIMDGYFNITKNTTPCRDVKCDYCPIYSSTITEELYE